MSTLNLSLISNTTVFGTTVRLTSDNGKYNEIVCENLENDPLRNMDRTLTTGYQFRSPDIRSDDWQSAFSTLENIEGSFNVTVNVVKKKDVRDIVTAHARFESQSDAAMFAWSNTDKWQKWDDTKEAEAQKEAKRRPRKLKINDDGTVTIKVTSTTITD